VAACLHTCLGEMAYPPIGDHALLGDGRTAALVTRDACIDWMCWPDFDSSTLFAALLDARRGGRFTVDIAGPATRRYLPRSLVLETRFPGARLTDFLAAGERALVRIVEAEARVEVRVGCTPRPGYGSRAPRLSRRDERSVALHDPIFDLVLSSDRPLALDEGRISARFTLEPGERAWLRLDEGAHTDVDLLLRRTLDWWREFAARLHPAAPEVERAALVLKALCYTPTGALVSAPTTSLPDRRGGQRNWDYRYAWLHDAAFSLWALDGAGAEEEALALYRWLFSVARGRHPATVHALYGVRGEEELHERELIHLAGYRGSRPVRVGNAAAAELELDVFGELLEALYTFGPRFGTRLDDLRTCRAFVDWVAHHWRDPDQGLWEVRSRKRAFVYSRAGSWLALDRGLRLFADAPDTDLRRWRVARDSVFAEVLERGFDQRLGAFVQAYDSRVLDASALRLPLMGFLPAGDPRMRATVAEIEHHLMPDGLVHRWIGDDEPEAWAPCTFWLVEVLALQGRLDDAAALYRHALSFANDLGLFAEDIDAPTRTQWGNFPYASAHLAVLSASQRLEGRGRGFADVRRDLPEAPLPVR
jgi:GH15 family glucan-1,4-alpha-glucosidase